MWKILRQTILSIRQGGMTLLTPEVGEKMNVKIQRNAVYGDTQAVIYEQHFTLELHILFKYFVFLIKDAVFYFFAYVSK